MKMKCELCKSLNMIKEAKKHPSASLFYTLKRKVYAIRTKDAKAISSFCEEHRQPLKMIQDVIGVVGYVAEVERLVENPTIAMKKAIEEVAYTIEEVEEQGK